MPEIECQFCGWLGDPCDLMDAHGQRVCPDCGSEDIEDYEPGREDAMREQLNRELSNMNPVSF